jgi:hypothetical protein
LSGFRPIGSFCFKFFIAFKMKASFVGQRSIMKGARYMSSVSSNKARNVVIVDGVRYCLIVSSIIADIRCHFLLSGTVLVSIVIISFWAFFCFERTRHTFSERRILASLSYQIDSHISLSFTLVFNQTYSQNTIHSCRNSIWKISCSRFRQICFKRFDTF